MGATFKLILREDKLRKDGKAPIYLRMTVDRKTRMKAVGIYLEPEYWNEDRQVVRRSHDLSTALNAKLQDLQLKAQQAALKADTAKGIKARIEGTGGRFDSYLQEFINRRERRDQFWERKKYSTTLRKLRGAAGRDEIRWKELKPDLLRDFERHCIEERGNNANTTRKELSRVRRVVRQAIKDGLLDANDNPFLRYDLPKKVPTSRRRLRRAEIEAIAGADVTGEELVARDAFVFAFYAGGMRFGDVCQLQASDVVEGRLRYTMMKTEQQVDLPLPPPALEIIERYTNGRHFLFPFLDENDAGDPVRLRRRISSANAMVNESIKKVAEAADVNDPSAVSFHVARHSFADYARRSSGDLYAVSKALGHSSLQITENYLSSFDRDATDRLASDLWD